MPAAPAAATRAPPAATATSTQPGPNRDVSVTPPPPPPPPSRAPGSTAGGTDAAYRARMTVTCRARPARRVPARVGPQAAPAPHAPRSEAMIDRRPGPASQQSRNTAWSAAPPPGPPCGTLSQSTANATRTPSSRASNAGARGSSEDPAARTRGATARE